MRTTGNNDYTVFEKELLFLPQETLEGLLQREGTPLFVYDAKGLRAGLENIFAKFGGGDPSNIAFPVRACPRKAVLQILAAAGASAYCCTERELRLALESGFSGRNIVYAMVIANEKIAAELKELDARLQVANEKILYGPLPKRVDFICEHQAKNNTLAGAHKKRDQMGLTRKQVWSHAPKLAENGFDLGIVRLEALNATTVDTYRFRLKALIKYADDLKQDTGVQLSRIYPGSGVGVSYHRNGPELNEDLFVQEFAALMEGRQETLCWNMENRMVDPYGILVTTLIERIDKNRILLHVDTESDVLHHGEGVRFHHAGLLGKPWIQGRRVCSISGPRPERKDYFVDKTLLPEMEIGDKVILYDVGTALKDNAPVPVYLYREDGTTEQITAW